MKVDETVSLSFLMTLKWDAYIFHQANVDDADLTAETSTIDPFTGEEPVAQLQNAHHFRQRQSPSLPHTINW
jgi:hypothetical protein